MCVIILIIRNKEDNQSSIHYLGIKLTIHTMKLGVRVLKRLPKLEQNISGN